MINGWFRLIYMDPNASATEGDLKGMIESYPQLFFRVPSSLICLNLKS